MSKNYDERREIESIRENGETYGITDFSESEINRISNRIRKLFVEAVTKYEPYSAEEITVQQITVCGSFAHSDAIEHISDLDIRLVLDREVQNKEQITNYIKSQYDVTENDLFGFIDVQCHTNNSSDPQAVPIWSQ